MQARSPLLLFVVVAVCVFCKFSLHFSCNVMLQQVLGPLAGNTLFTEDDFKLLENFDMDLYARKVRDQVRSCSTLLDK